MAALKDELIVRLEKIPGISHVPYPERQDGFSALNHRGKEIGHFHNFNEIDLRLGKQLIRQEGLKHPADSSKHPKRIPNSPFIELRFHHQRDISKVVHLVGLLVSKHLN